MSNIIPTGMEHLSWQDAQAESDAMHFEKNSPDPPKINGRAIKFPPYQYRSYPTAMYHETYGITAPKLVKIEQEQRDLEALGWTTEPNEMKAANDRYLESLQDRSAERAYTDRTMSPSATDEFHTADAAHGDTALLDLPVPKLNKTRGRPKRFAATT